jgi:hypothetical protein
MPLPSYLISASLLVCEKVLVEKDQVTSAIRIVDIFYVPALPPLPPGVLMSPEIKENFVPIVQAWGFVQIRANANYHREHDLEFRTINTIGEMLTIATAKARFESQIEGATTGITASAQLNIGVKRLGTCFLCVYLDGEEIARTPFTLTQLKVDAGQAV